MKKKITDQILMVVKMYGEATSKLIAEELSLTKEGARQHLINLTHQGLLRGEAISAGVGRPITTYYLTEKGMSKFPDTHAAVTVQLLHSVKNLLGENALDLLINDREQVLLKKYSNELKDAVSIESKLEILSNLRTEEGYMSEWKKDGADFLLIENHCPICAAAAECQGFCRSELSNFKQLIGSEYSIVRTEYILDNGNRCTYKISKKGV